MTQQELYKGFGEEHTLNEWARLLDIRLGVLRYCVEVQHTTVEEIAGAFGIVYPREKKRKPREGAHMVEGRKLIEELLRRSGYGVEPGSVVLKLIRYTTHKVTFNGKHVGKYDYKTGCLSNLFNGTHIPLKAPYSDQLKIQQNKYDCWEPTPGTKAIISHAYVEKLERKELPDFGEKYEELELLAESKKAAKKEEVLYEYKGRRATCVEWARRWDVADQSLRYHLNRGLTLEEIARKWGIQ